MSDTGNGLHFDTSGPASSSRECSRAAYDCPGCPDYHNGYGCRHVQRCLFVELATKERQLAALMEASDPEPCWPSWRCHRSSYCVLRGSCIRWREWRTRQDARDAIAKGETP